MNKIFTFALAILASVSCEFISFSGESSKNQRLFLDGPVQVDTLDLRDFDAITVNGTADVSFIQANEFLVELKANEGLLEQLNCRVEDGMLILAFKENVKIRPNDFDFVIKAPFIKSFTVNGAADLDIDNYLSDSELLLEVNGAGDLDINNVLVPSLSIELRGAGDIKARDIETDSLSVSVKGAGDAKLSGHAGKARFLISGAGDIDVRGLKTDQIEQEKHGVGRIRL